MDKLEILKYICEHDLDYGIDDSELYKAQMHYYKNHATIGTTTETFDPLEWLCNNASEFFKECKIIYTNNDDKTPISVFYQDKCIFHNGMMKKKSLTVVCEFYITHKYTKTSWGFDRRTYYALYHNIIDKFDKIYRLHKYSASCIEDPTLLFYILYGFWNNVTLKPIDGYIFIASEPNLIEKYTTYVNTALSEYYSNNLTVKLTFCPFTYAASNHEKLSIMLSNCKLCINEDGQRFTKHYIRNGYADKLCTNSFDKWTYLANNYKRIRALMPRNAKNKIIWDLYSLTNDKVAADYLKRIEKTQKNVFNEIQFVKTYIDDEYVNKSRKLNIENAAEYFVTYYVLHKTVRYNMTLVSKILSFLQGRAIDTMKQIPLNASRFVIETKFL